MDSSTDPHRFTHVGNLTGYMQLVFDQIVQHVAVPARILDVPAGNGLLGQRLGERGFGVSNRMTNVASMRVTDKSYRIWRIAGHGKEMKV